MNVVCRTGRKCCTNLLIIIKTVLKSLIITYTLLSKSLLKASLTAKSFILPLLLAAEDIFFIYFIQFLFFLTDCLLAYHFEGTSVASDKSSLFNCTNGGTLQ